MNILITGATGFVGSHLLQYLLKNQQNSDDSFRVITRNLNNNLKLDALKRAINNLTDKCEFFEGDITNKESIKEAFKDVHSVYHLAALMTDQAAEFQNLNDVNIKGTENIIKLCIENNVKNLIYASSVVTIGSGFSNTEIKNETSECNTVHLNNKNFLSKREAEKLVLAANGKNSLNSFVVNPSLIYGAGDALKKIRQGNIKVAQGKQKYYIEGGVNIVAVEDVVDAMSVLVDKATPGERYILSGDNISIKELMRLIAQAAGVSPPEKKIPTGLLLNLGRIGSFLKLKGSLNSENVKAASLWHWYDNSKAKAQLGFNPRPAKKAIKNSVDWMRKEGML